MGFLQFVVKFILSLALPCLIVPFIFVSGQNMNDVITMMVFNTLIFAVFGSIPNLLIYLLIMLPIEIKFKASEDHSIIILLYVLIYTLLPLVLLYGLSRGNGNFGPWGPAGFLCGLGWAFGYALFIATNRRLDAQRRRESLSLNNPDSAG